jgi:hypothetical protein
MASRKKTPDPNQIGFTLPEEKPSPVPLPEIPPPASFDLDDLDDYPEDATRLRLVDPPAPMPTVIVEAVGRVFEVSRLRDNGTTVACVMWTRSELEELIRRATAALEVTR